jgi:hypothetical protein
LSAELPTADMDWRTPACWQAVVKALEVYCLDSTGRRNTVLLEQE